MQRFSSKNFNVNKNNSLFYGSEVYEFRSGKHRDKSKENNTDKLNLSGQTARQPISHEFLTIYKQPMYRKLLSKTLFTLHIHNVIFCV